MHIQLSRLRLRKALSYLALVSILGLSALGLNQCRLVDDTVTGIDTRTNARLDDDDNNNNNNNNNRSRCEKQCNQDYKRCLEKEEARHKVAKRQCKSLPSTKQRECKKQESRRNEANERQCRTQKNECKRACGYREGSGRGGR